MLKSRILSLSDWLKRSFIHRKQGLAEATIFITAISFVSRAIGYLREVLIANYFGASGQTDAFLVALVIPTMVTGLIANGLTTLMIPVYMEKNSKDPEKAKKFVNQIFYLSCGFFLLASFIILIFAPFFVKIAAPGFSGEGFKLAVTLTRYLVPAGFAMVFIGFFTGIYSAQKNFSYPAIVAIIGNALVVMFIILLTPQLGINSWTIGQLAYAILSFAALFWVLWRKDGLFQNFSIKDSDWVEIKRFMRLVLPVILSSSIFILNQIADKVVASYLKEGSIAILNFAQRVYSIPLSLLAMPLITAIYPTFSSLTLDKGSGYAEMLKKALSLSWYLLIPISAVFIILPDPIIKLLFQRGAFTAGDTELTALSVSYYSIGLFAYATNYFLVYLLYSFKNTRAPFFVGLASVGINIVGNLVLSRYFGVAGIALATAVSSIIGLALYRFTPLKDYLGKIFLKNIVRELFKITVASLPISLLAFFAKPFFSLSLDSGALLIRLIVIAIISLVIYLVMSRILKLEGFRIITQYFKKTILKGG